MYPPPPPLFLTFRNSSDDLAWQFQQWRIVDLLDRDGYRCDNVITPCAKISQIDFISILLHSNLNYNERYRNSEFLIHRRAFAVRILSTHSYFLYVIAGPWRKRLRYRHKRISRFDMQYAL